MSTICPAKQKLENLSSELDKTRSIIEDSQSKEKAIDNSLQIWRASRRRRSERLEMHRKSFWDAKEEFDQADAQCKELEAQKMTLNDSVKAYEEKIKEISKEMTLLSAEVQLKKARAEYERIAGEAAAAEDARCEYKRLWASFLDDNDSNYYSCASQIGFEDTDPSNACEPVESDASWIKMKFTALAEYVEELEHQRSQFDIPEFLDFDDKPEPYLKETDTNQGFLSYAWFLDDFLAKIDTFESCGNDMIFETHQVVVNSAQREQENLSEIVSRLWSEMHPQTRNENLETTSTEHTIAASRVVETGEENTEASSTDHIAAATPVVEMVEEMETTENEVTGAPIEETESTENADTAPVEGGALEEMESTENEVTGAPIEEGVLEEMESTENALTDTFVVEGTLEEIETFEDEVIETQFSFSATITKTLGITESDAAELESSSDSVCSRETVEEYDMVSTSSGQEEREPYQSSNGEIV